MICGDVDGLVDAAACAADDDSVVRHFGLRDEVLVCGFDVGGKFLIENHVRFLGCEFADGGTAAVAVAAKIDGHDAESGGGEASGEVVPDFALAVALVEQEDAWTWFTVGEKGAFEAGAVGRFEVHKARRNGISGDCASGQQEWSNQQQGEKPRGNEGAGHETSLRMIVGLGESQIVSERSAWG